MSLRKSLSSYGARAAAAVSAVAGLYAYWVVIAMRRLHRGEFSDFRVFYFAANAMLHHGDPYTPRFRSYIYPPLLAFLYAPLAMLSQRTAATLVLYMNVAIVLAAMIILVLEFLRRFENPVDLLTVAAISFLALVSIFDKVKGELQMFQTNAMTLLAFVLALRWLDRHPIWSGIALGFAFNIKYLPIVALPYLLLRRRWIAAISMAVACIGFALLPATLSGWHENLRHLSISYNGLLKMVGVHVAGEEAAVVGDVKAGFSLSLTSAAARLASSSKIPLLAPLALIGLLAASLAIVAFAYRLNRFPLLRWPASSRQAEQPYRGLMALEWIGLMSAALIFSPQTNSRHLVLVMPATVLLSMLILVPRKGVGRLVAVFAILILALGLTFPWGGSTTQFARKFRAWYKVGGQSWCILSAYLILLWAGLRYINAVLRASPRVELFPLREREVETLNVDRASLGS